MQVKKSLVVAAAVAGVGIASLTGLGVASAATSTSSSDDPKSSLVDKLVSKFNLDKGEVEAVFEEERTDREAKAKQHMEERLSQAVSDGKLTEDQKQKILAKWEEMHANMKSHADKLKDMTPEERRDFKEQHAGDLKTWAEENGIPEEYQHFGMVLHKGPMHKKFLSGPSESAN
jgi:hypothetical protein